MIRLKKKAYLIFSLLLLLFGLSGGSISSVSGSAEYVAAAQGQSVYRLDVAQTRGMIYDCNLRPLVSGAKKWVAAVAPTIEAIGALEKATGGKYRDRLAMALEDGKPFLLELEEGPSGLEDNPCIDLFSVPVRYGENQLASHAVGYLDGMGNGASGIELAMNDALEERSGQASVYYQVDALGRVLPGGDRQVSDTLWESRGGVTLTLDSDIQQLVVVTETPGCEIRALCSLPGYSPSEIGKAAQAEDSPLVNRAFCAYAPGSVFKLVSAASALEAGSPLKDYTCTGAVNAGGMLFHCIDGTAHGKVDLARALEVSCNCYFINCARALGGQNVLSMAYNLGLGAGQEFGRGLFSASGILPEASALENFRALANFAFGQGEITVTPVQMCGMVNAIASGGIYASPKLIAGTVDSEGKASPVQVVTDKSLRAMNAVTAAFLQDCMESTVKEGTAKPGDPKNCVAGVKTGTAQTGVYRGGEELLHFWYCGYVSDAAGPRYCISVLSESTPDDKGATARVFRAVARGLGERMASSR